MYNIAASIQHCTADPLSITLKETQIKIIKIGKEETELLPFEYYSTE